MKNVYLNFAASWKWLNYSVVKPRIFEIGGVAQWLEQWLHKPCVTSSNLVTATILLPGEVAERSNAAASKVVYRFIGTGVRIPPSPQKIYKKTIQIDFYPHFVSAQQRTALSLSGGVFYTHYRRTDFSNKMNDKFKAVYLMAGGTVHIKDVSIELTFADSHLFSSEYRKQTLVKAGIGYSF